MDTEANLVPSVPIHLDRERHLKFDLNACCQIEKQTGKNYFTLIAPGGLTATDLRAFLWAGLVHEDEELTVEAVGEMIRPGSIEHILEAIGKAVSESLPEPKEMGMAEGGRDPVPLEVAAQSTG